MKTLHARAQSSASSSLAGVSVLQRMLCEQAANLVNVPPVHRSWGLIMSIRRQTWCVWGSSNLNTLHHQNGLYLWHTAMFAVSVILQLSHSSPLLASSPGCPVSIILGNLCSLVFLPSSLSSYNQLEIKTRLPNVCFSFSPLFFSWILL